MLNFTVLSIWYVHSRMRLQDQFRETLKIIIMFSILKSLFGKPVDFQSVLNRGAIIIDVRSNGEFKSGSVKGARNIPLDQLSSKVSELKKTGKPIITVCRSGARSGMAKSILANAGLEVYNGGPWISLASKIS